MASTARGSDTYSSGSLGQSEHAEKCSPLTIYGLLLRCSATQEGQEGGMDVAPGVSKAEAGNAPGKAADQGFFELERYRGGGKEQEDRTDFTQLEEQERVRKRGYKKKN